MSESLLNLSMDGERRRALHCHLRPLIVSLLPWFSWTSRSYCSHHSSPS